MRRKHRFQPRQKKEEGTGWGKTQFPLEANVGVYARQSTQWQVKYATNSTEMQTDDLVDFARRLGWTDERIIVFTQDLGRSGRLRIDEREGLRTLVSYIEAGSVKAVVVFQEDRLFRDETQIQVNTFITLCKEHDVLVITPSMTYNFQNRFHVKEFRWKCEAAADYITDYVMSRLVAARHKVAERGEYDGRGIPIGYILDRRERIRVNGVDVKNPDCGKKFIIYEPHAQVVRWLFERYMMLGGNLTRLCREIQAIPILFPAFGPEVDVRNVAKVNLKRVNGGYHITRRGLIMLLTNVTYLGWWTLLGEVIGKDNHPAIVAEEMFWYAFHRMSEYTVDGEKNERAFSPRRYEKNGNYDAAQALLKDIISTQNLGAVYVTGSHNRDSSKCWYYGLFEKELGLLVEYHTAIAVPDLDEIFVARLLEHLRQTVDFSHYRQYAQAEKQRLVNEQVSIKGQLAEVEKLIAGTFATLRLPEEELDNEARREIAKQNRLLLEQKRLLEKKLSEPERVRRVKKLLEYDSLIERVATTWHQHSFEDRKALVEALTEKVLIDTMAPHWFRVIIQWRNPAWGEDEAYIWRAYGSNPLWTEAENQILRECYPTSYRASLLEKLPQRSWSAITFQANQLKLTRCRKNMKPNTPIPANLTVLDWQFMEEHRIFYKKAWGSKFVLWSAAHLSCTNYRKAAARRNLPPFRQCFGPRTSLPVSAVAPVPPAPPARAPAAQRRSAAPGLPVPPQRARPPGGCSRRTPP